MRAKYLATLVTVSMLSLGFIGACANPCAGKTTGGSETTQEGVNPCAAKDVANPCAAKDSTNPCAAKGGANPCAAKDDTKN